MVCSPQVVTEKVGHNITRPRHMSQGKNWCFTINNWTEEEFQLLQDIEVQYLVVGKEVGENLTPHLQGYVQLKKKLRTG